MFVCSIKTSKKQILSMLICVVMLIAILIVAVAWPGGESSAQTYSPVTAADDAGRIAFLQDLGYEVTPQGAEVREVLIPDEFDDVFAGYNDIQKTAGMDLEPYHGKRVKCWTYTVTNYPGEENVVAHLYIYKDKIVGGDISSTALDGFMHGLTPAIPAQPDDESEMPATTLSVPTGGTTAAAAA